MSDMDEIKNIAPKLSNIKKENPFKIPEGYFDNFSSRLSEKIHGRETPGFYEKHVLTLKPYLVAAALIVAVIITGKILYNMFYHESNIGDLKSSEIADLISEDAYYISEESIMDIIYANDIAEEDNKTDDDNNKMTNEVIDYLIDEDIDLIDIIDAIN